MVSLKTAEVEGTRAMADILERLNPMLWRVRCPACGRIYQTTGWPKAIARRRSCTVCTVRTGTLPWNTQTAPRQGRRRVMRGKKIRGGP
jgi:hypothetical protein